MIDKPTLDTLITGLKSGQIVPYLGAGALSAVTSLSDGKSIPADSDSLILAMNNGQPMAPRLMYEFPRAAMNLELKKGRSFVERFLTETYGNQKWSESPLHQWLTDLELPYVIDINRDTQLQGMYQGRPHVLVVGVARITATDYRFKLYQSDGGAYSPVTQEEADWSLPILFKSMGTPTPEPNYVAADADYVDYITELMGGFAIPDHMKNYRLERQYLFLGMHFTRDTERMVMSDIIYGSSKPSGWALISNPSDKERRFCKNRQIEIIEADWTDLLSAVGIADAA